MTVTKGWSGGRDPEKRIIKYKVSTGVWEVLSD